jgi:hypothetical protein
VTKKLLNVHTYTLAAFAIRFITLEMDYGVIRKNAARILVSRFHQILQNPS